MFFPFKITILVFLPPFSALINNLSAMGMEEKQVPYYPSLESNCRIGVSWKQKHSEIYHAEGGSIG